MDNIITRYIKPQNDLKTFFQLISYHISLFKTFKKTLTANNSPSLFEVCKYNNDLLHDS